jgi:hypothetical protein
MISSDARELIVRALLAGLSVDVDPDDQFTASADRRERSGRGCRPARGPHDQLR